ncbi:protein arginine N-methyltransferase 6-like [Clavelina lepadiformis]|uniref:protein arginine N-methyltransferase 6-like n=1 Tax=Clavelina lepadiformis TaxID=159417 RepID=UPI004041D70D
MRISFSFSTIKLVKMAGQFKPKRPKLAPNAEKSYFESYADITVHEEMLGDDIRTNIYKKALFNSKNAIKDKVVLDVGAGTGILSCFCAQAGAKKVYAVEASSIAEQAKKVIMANGLQDQIDVIQGVMEDITLPEKVDVIVSEWMGYCLLYESMLTSVISARDKWLKEGGLLFPDSAMLYIAPICDDEIMVDKVNFWNDMEEVYGVDMSCLLPFARRSLSKEVMVKCISCENVLSHPQLLAHFDLNKVSHHDIQAVHHKFQFSSFGIADFQGFAVWFDVAFSASNSAKMNLIRPGILNGISQQINDQPPTPQGTVCKHDVSDASKLTNEEPKDLTMKKFRSEANTEDISSQALILSTSPYKPETHWKQSLLYLDSEIEVAQDSTIAGTITLKPCLNNYRFLSISLKCEVDKKKEIAKTYLMGYELPNKNKEE